MWLLPSGAAPVRSGGSANAPASLARNYQHVDSWLAGYFSNMSKRRPPQTKRRGDLAEQGHDQRTADVQPDTHLTYLIAKVSHRLQRDLDRALKDVDLTLAQFSALAHIARRPGLSNADLARALLISPQATTTLTSRLTRRGLVERPSAPRGKVCPVRLTESGVRTLLAAEEIAVAAERDALSVLTAHQLSQVSTLLERLLTHLGETPLVN